MCGWINKRLMERVLFKYVSIIIFIVFGFTASCKKASDSNSDVNELKDGLKTSNFQDFFNDDRMASKKKTVLIYYANDSSYDSTGPLFRQYDVLKRALYESALDSTLTEKQKVALNKFRLKLEDDLTKFGKVVKDEVEDLRQIVCSGNTRFTPAENSIAVAVFTNRFARNNVDQTGFGSQKSIAWRHCSTEGGSSSQFVNETPIVVQGWNQDKNWIYNDQPLAHRNVFSAAISAVGKKYPAKDYQYILVTKSHGSSQIVMSPYIQRDLVKYLQGGNAQNSINVDRRRELAAALASGYATGLGKEELGGEAYLSTGIEAINRQLMKISNAGEVGTEYGITKDEYLITLASLGSRQLRDIEIQHGSATREERLRVSNENFERIRSAMYFPIVFMESCKSDLALDTSKGLEAVISEKDRQRYYANHDIRNIGYLYTSDKKGLPYRTMDYQSILALRQLGDRNRPKNSQSAFKEYLDQLHANGLQSGATN